MAVKPSGIKTSKHDDGSYLCLCSDGKNISVNPSQLSRFSGYFSSLLHSEMKETKTRTLRLKLISSNILQLIVNQLARCQKRREEGIEFLEKNQPSLSTLTEILDAADYLDIPILREVCDEFVCRTMPVSKLTFQELLALNHKYSLTRLGQALVNYMSSHVREICTMEGWLAQLPSALLEDLLASNDTKVMSEWELVVLVEQWLRCGTASRSSDRDKHLEPILRHIRVPEIVRDREESTVPEGLRPGILAYIMNEIKVYKADPKSYRALHPEQSNIRRPVDVVVSLGTHDSIPSMFFCLPVSYASLTDKDSASVETFRHRLQFSELRHSSFQLPVLCLREFSACSLNNILYIAGGQNSFSDSGQDALTYVFELDLADLRWTEVCQMKDPRCLFYLGALNGNLYAVGGINSTGELSTVERYEPFQDEWMYQAPLPYPIHEHAGCVQEGCLYISGGHTGVGQTNAVSCLNPTVGEWVECAPLQCARSYHTMTAFKDQLFVIGGCSISDGEVINIQTCESYSIVQNQWTMLETKFPSAYSAALTSFSSDDETVLCFGGYSFLTRHFDTFACIFYVEKGEWQVVPIRFADARMKEVVMTQVKIREKTCMQYFMSTATV